MKLCNILVDGACHLACDTATGLKDLTAAGLPLTMDEVIAMLRMRLYLSSNRISLPLQIPSLPMW